YRTTSTATSASLSLLNPCSPERLVQKLLHIGAAVAKVPCRLLPMKFEPRPLPTHQLQTRTFSMAPQLKGRVQEIDVGGQARPLDNAAADVSAHSAARVADNEPATPDA